MKRSGQTVEGEVAWRELTWAEVEDWAGLRSVERGREYCRAGRVIRLAVEPGGEVLAWVRGGQGYSVRVRLDPLSDGSAIRSACTCPLPEPGCKHAVAAVLAYLDALRSGREVPAAEDDLAWSVPDLPERENPGAPGEAGDTDIEREREAIESALRWPVPSACESVLPRLRRLRALLLAAGREAEWDEYEGELRALHWRRPRMIEVLDRLRSRRRIIPA